MSDEHAQSEGSKSSTCDRSHWADSMCGSCREVEVHDLRLQIAHAGYI